MSQNVTNTPAPLVTEKAAKLKLKNQNSCRRTDKLVPLCQDIHYICMAMFKRA